MLESLSFPRNLSNVPEYAGRPYEKVDGTGCLRGLKGDEIWIQARIMAIADIFAALTASDRPRLQERPEALRVFKNYGVHENRESIDPEIFDGFVKNQVFLDCAEELFDPEQVDEIDKTRISGYSS